MTQAGLSQDQLKDAVAAAAIGRTARSSAQGCSGDRPSRGRYEYVPVGYLGHPWSSDPLSDLSPAPFARAVFCPHRQTGLAGL